MDTKPARGARTGTSLIAVFVLCLFTVTAIAASEPSAPVPGDLSQASNDLPMDAEPTLDAALPPVQSEAEPPPTDDSSLPPAPIEQVPPAPSEENDLSPPGTSTDPPPPSTESDLSPPPAEPVPSEPESPAPPAVPEPTAPPPDAQPKPEVDDQVEPIPASTPAATATAAPTPSPTGTPVPTPTAVPAIPFDPDLVCIKAPGNVAPVQGDQKWSYLDCEVTWATTNVASVSILPVRPVITWDIVALNEPGTQDPGKLILDPQPLDLIGAIPGDDTFASSRFHLAMRVSCVDETAISVPLQFRATSGEDALVETATERLLLNATAATLPEVTLISAEFEDASPPNGTAISTGVITMYYSNASENCGWNITTVVNDFVEDDDVLPASDLSLVSVQGPLGLTSTIEDGQITILAAPGVSMPASGSLLITVSMPVPETVNSGVYSTTITADAGAP